MKNRIIIDILVGLLIGSVLLICIFFTKKSNNVSETQIEPQITSETTTTSTTTTTTAKTTKKVVKTTKKITQVKATKKTAKKTTVATGSKVEYMQYAKEYGNLNDTQMQCLDYLWTHESNWNPNDVNKSSGACGIPQAYPCKKIQQSEGTNDWKAQIRWGIKYISNRYKNPCAAWNHFKNKKWY